MRNPLLAGLLLLAGCSPTPQSGNDQESSAPSAGENGAGPIQPGAAIEPPPSSNAAAGTKSLPPVEPPAPGTAGGLPDDRNPVSEAPFAPTSAQGAANLVQTYYALLESGRYRDAWKLWSGAGEASGMSREAFAASFARYAEYHAQIGAPGEIEGAAGSLYVEVPVIVYGRMKSGEAVHMSGPVTLRRVNDVPGSTAEQRKWHITASGVRPRPR
jgi:hypothetical protein